MQTQRKTRIETDSGRGEGVSLTALAALSLLVLLALVPGCVSPRERLEPTYVSRVKPGMHRSEVLKLLGQPFATRSTTNGVSGDEYVHAWTLYSDRMGYQRSHDLCVRGVEVLYDTNGRVERVALGDARVPCETWADRRGFHAAVGGALGKIAKGKTPREDVVRELGDPFLEVPHPSGGTELVWMNFRQDNADIVRFSGEECRVVLDSSGVVQDLRVVLAPTRWPR